MCKLYRRAMANPMALIAIAWTLFALFMAALALPASARADVDPCSFERPRPVDRSFKDPLYQAPDAFTPDQRKVS
jgi:hypothetical protein